MGFTSDWNVIGYPRRIIRQAFWNVKGN